MRLTAPVPRRSVSGPNLSSSIYIPPTNGDSVNYRRTGIHLPDNSTVVIHVNGTVNLAAVSGYGVLNSHGHLIGDVSQAGNQAPATGLVVNGWPSNYLKVTVILATSGYTPSLTLDPDSAVSAASTRTITLHIAKGEDLLVSRTTVPGGLACNSDSVGAKPCGTPYGPMDNFNVAGYVQSGSQTLVVERLSDDVTLTAVPSTGAKGRSVTFTATPVTPGGGVTAWAWTPDSTSGNTVACPGGPNPANPCVIPVYESGTMDVAYYLPNINLTRHAKVHVTTVDCPTGDSVLDDPHFRQVLKALYDASGAETLPYAQRREKAGAYYRDPGVDTTTFRPFPDASSPCTFDVPNPFPTSPPITWLLAIPHAHPTDTAETVPPHTCPLAPTGGHTEPGPSTGDDRTAANAGVPVFAIDKRNVYRTDGTRASHKTWPRQSNTCNLF